MLRWARAITVVGSLVMTLVFASPGLAETAKQVREQTGVFAVDCDRTQRKPIDPIAPAGRRNFSHLHDFFGARRIFASSSPSRLAGGRHSCSLPQDHSTYWMPSLFSHGRVQEGDALQVYYYLPKGAQAIPRGLIMVAGDAARRDATNPKWSSWSCQQSSDYGQTNPPPCKADGWYLAEIDFPSCWDGQHLDSADHRSHMAYPTADGCPSGHPEQLAMVVMFRSFTQDDGPLDDIQLSSGPPASLHADFVSGWNPGDFARLIAACGARDCGHLEAMPS
ncbi:MAG: DUF1996 domain-containing protein [Actinobacteria bacterium]|nr:DUF1996 domain-containing protein [Actinomycetota bacterium]